MNQPTEQNTKSIHTLSLKEFVNRACEKIPQLWETITSVIFFFEDLAEQPQPHMEAEHSGAADSLQTC